MRSVVGARLRAELLYARAARLLFERALARGARPPRRDALRRAVVQARGLLAQLAQAVLLVAVLAPLLAARDDDSARHVSEAHARFDLVDVLPARPARAERLRLALAQEFFVRLGQLY